MSKYKPFEPKLRQRYWYIAVADKEVVGMTWVGTTVDYAFKYCGNCFRTQAEAEAHKYEIYERLTGKKWIEVAE